MVLGNLCSDAFEANAAATRQALLATRQALNRIAMLVEDPDPSTRLYAVGAMQNIVVDEALALAAVEEGAVRAIERVLRDMPAPPAHEVPGPDDSAEANIYYFASGALLNMNDALEASTRTEDRKSAAPKLMRELSGRSPTMRSLKGWRKLRSIGALQISESTPPG